MQIVTLHERKMLIMDAQHLFGMVADCNPVTGHCRWWLWDEPPSFSLYCFLSAQPTHNPPTLALTNSPSLTHNQILLYPNQPTDLGFFKYSCDPPVFSQ